MSGFLPWHLKEHARRQIPACATRTACRSSKHCTMLIRLTAALHVSYNFSRASCRSFFLVLPPYKCHDPCPAVRHVNHKGIADQKCVSWTVNTGQNNSCYLRGSFTGPTKPGNDCTSGRIPGRGPAPSPPSPPPTPGPPPVPPPKGAKNVLLITIDDLRPQLGYVVLQW